MFQVIVMWNLTRPDQELGEIVKNIKLRGYNKDTFITGEFAWKIAEEKIKPLSVSDIADRYCPTRRDLYFRKGIGRLSKKFRKGEDTWGSKAGNFVEEYILNIVKSENFNRKEKMHFIYKIIKTLKTTYRSIIEISEEKHMSYMNSNDIKKKIRRLEELEEVYPKEKGNTEWLEKLLKSNGRAEVALNYLNNILRDKMSITKLNILTGNEAKIDVNPQDNLDKIKQIGINLPATPDFIIPEYGIVGDIKTGIKFKPHFQLTCAGYALAYENVKGKSNYINWGIIYFFPTRNPSLFRKSITFAQVYIFPIDDYLRSEFLAKRDEAYAIISNPQKPYLPQTNEREHCEYCRFKEICIQDGLNLEVGE
ncbi:MAG: CRISPR-associated protein Cas4 [Candidatus Odinarchaeota archaeon]|nr:CRISPR-associated protein Cas4 [Candidatus Odinarchaeota archaeon]